MKYIFVSFIVTFMVLQYNIRPNMACTRPPVQPPTQPPDEETPTERQTERTITDETTMGRRRTERPTRRTRPPTRRPTTSSGAPGPLPSTSRPVFRSTLPPAVCSNIPLEFNSVSGMAPLYGTNPDGINDYLVVLKDGMSCKEMMQKIKSMKSSRGTSSMKAMESTNGVNTVVVDLDEEQVNEIRAMEGVKYVEKDGVVSLSAATNVWGIDRIDQRGLPLDSRYLPKGNGSGSVVYVIDSGVVTGHELFGNRASTVYDGVGDGLEDCTGHGTHVAGTVGAAGYGVATGVEIRSVRVFGCSDESFVRDIIAGINFVLDHGERGQVVSMSFGGSVSFALDDAVTRLINAGFISVTSAGNNATDACGSSPARLPMVITVGAISINDIRPSFSNFGPAVDIFAPGVRIPSIDFETGGTLWLSGTSAAAPHVSGVAAILLAEGTPVTRVREKILDLSTKDIVGDTRGSNNRLLFIGEYQLP